MQRFVPGHCEATTCPLAAYRQLLPEPLVTTYLAELSEPGSLVVSPFAQSDTVNRMALALGRRAVSATANPLLALLIRAEARPISSRQLDTLLSAIGNSLKLHLTFRRHLLDLYRTRCPICRSVISADYFVWEREPRRPIAKSYHCASCGSSGETSVDAPDLKIASDYQGRNLSFWRALHRVARRDDPYYDRARDLLELYTGRNLYALLELTVSIESLVANETERDSHRAILLQCLDLGASLDSPERSRRLARLGLPARFLERNVWHLFEMACQSARTRSAKSILPFETQLGSPCPHQAILTGGIGQLSGQLPPKSISLVLGVPPSPGPAFWTLSYLWTAWLWGKAKAGNLSVWMKRYSSDWDWYLEAMRLALQAITPTLADGGKIVLAFRSEGERLVEAILAAAGLAGLSLEGIALQPCPRAENTPSVEYRLVLARRQTEPIAMPPADSRQRWEHHLGEVGWQGVREVLEAWGEPTPGPYVHAGAYKGILHNSLLEQSPWIAQPAGLLPLLEHHVWDRIKLRIMGEADTRPLQRRTVQLDREQPGLDPMLWWDSSAASGQVVPLSDRVEQRLSEILTAGPLSAGDVSTSVYHAFLGLCTPTEELIRACLTSYGMQTEAGLWALRPEDDPRRRAEEIQDILSMLDNIGRRLNARIQRHGHGSDVCGQATLLNPNEVIWSGRVEPPALFRVVADTVRANLSCRPDIQAIAPNLYLVIPGGRASLVSYRRRACPLWDQEARQLGWRFIKYRHVRRLHEEKDIAASSLTTIVGLDPIVEQDEVQTPLF